MNPDAPGSRSYRSFQPSTSSLSGDITGNPFPNRIPGFDSDIPASADSLPTSKIPEYLLELTAEREDQTRPAEVTSEEQETQRLHFKVIRFIFHSATKVHAKSITLATACALYHKIFTLCSPHQYDPYLMATTSLYLSGKIEEDHLKLRDIINVCYNTLHPDRPPLEIGKTYWSLRETVVQCELFIMRLLSFRVSFNHPHKYLLHYIKSVQDLLPPHIVSKTPIASTAWAILRDSYHGNICLECEPEHLAVCSLYLALEMLGVEVPLNTRGECTWWEALVPGTKLINIRKTVREIINIYRMEVTVMM